MNFPKPIQKVVSKVNQLMLGMKEEPTFKRLVSDYDWNGFKRIYFVHIRKTGGTSINNQFLALSGEPHKDLYSRLTQKSDHRLSHGDLVYVGWNRWHINRGTYFYAFSHLPLHQLSLPRETFTFSCFRDPVRRVVSLYTMLCELRLEDRLENELVNEAKWLGNSFEDFLSRVPKEHLMNQLYMFSPTFDVEDALVRAKSLSYYFFVDQFDDGIASLNDRLGIELQPMHIRKTKYKEEISESLLNQLRDRLADEYAFLDHLRRLQSSVK